MPYLVQGGSEAFKQDTMKKVAGIGKLKLQSVIMNLTGKNEISDHGRCSAGMGIPYNFGD